MSQLNVKRVRLGDDADPSKNFIISVPDVADGTLTIKRENGEGVVSVSAAGVITGTNDSLLCGNVPLYRGYLPTTDQTVTSGAWTKVTATAETFDTEGWYDAPNARFTPQQAGYYQIAGRILGTGGSLSVVGVAIYKNGSAVANVLVTVGSLGNSSIYTASLVYLNGTTDYIELYGLVSASSAPKIVAGDASSAMSGFLVRTA